MEHGRQDVSQQTHHGLGWVLTPLAALGAILLALFDHEDEPNDPSDR